MADIVKPEVLDPVAKTEVKVVGEARRNASAMLFSSRCGLSAQTLANALAVERLMPA